jgi:predicted PhzF superfamily epimerase YddE/YHI9
MLYGASAGEPNVCAGQGIKMGRQSFVHIQLEHSDSADLPSRIEVGGGVVPVLTAELTLQNEIPSPLPRMRGG